MGVQPRIDLCLDWRRGSGNRPNRVSAPAARLRLAAQRGEYESLGIAAPLAMGPAAKRSTFPGDSHSPRAADRLLKAQPRSRVFEHVNWAGPRRPAWEVFWFPPNFLQRGENFAHGKGRDTRCHGTDG